MVVRNRGCPGFGKELLIRYDLQAAMEMDDAVLGEGFSYSLYSAPGDSDGGEVHIGYYSVFSSGVGGLVGFPGDQLRTLEGMEVEVRGGFVSRAFTLRLLLLFEGFIEPSLHAANFGWLRERRRVAGHW